MLDNSILRSADDFNAFGRYGNFDFFALTLHLEVLAAKNSYEQAKCEYSLYKQTYDAFDEDYDYRQEIALHSDMFEALHILHIVQNIEDTFVRWLSDEAKSALPDIWLRAEKAFEKTKSLRKAG